MSAPVFYTVGHSNLAIGEFIDSLKNAAVTMVVDVRRLPGSRTYPQYNQQELIHSLQRAGIQYRHCAGLAGRRKKQGVDPIINGGWQNSSFHNYADYALKAAFHQALDRLVILGESHTVAIMCAESVWWRCHRRIIADYLLAAGYAVNNIIGPRITPARLTQFARVDARDQVTYPDDVASLK